MDPRFSGARGAIAAWASGAPPSETAAAGTAVAGIFAANESAVGIYQPLIGALVATYPAQGYARWLDWLAVRCTWVGTVDVFYGAVEEPGRITSWYDGSLSEFDPARPRYIPQGAAVMVVWAVPDGTHSASAKAGFRGAQ